MRRETSPSLSGASVRVFTWVGVGLVLMQRLAAPMTQGAVTIALPVVWLVLAVGLARGVVRLDPRRLLVVLALIAAALIVLFLAGGSAASLALVIALWLPAALGSDKGAEQQRAFLSGVIGSTVVAAAFAVIQAIVAASLGTLVDPIALLPEAWLVQGYNSSSPVVWGESWMKANGFFFLEPSMLSLMCVFALIALLSEAPERAWPRRWLLGSGLLLVAGALVSVAASGILLTPLLAWAILARGRRAVVAAASVSVLAAVCIAAVPVLAKGLSTRVFTLSLDAGSNRARLVRPYVELLPRLISGDALFGYGPGSAGEAVAIMGSDWQSEVTTPTVAKLLYEYGLVGLASIAVILSLVLLGSRLPTVTRIAILLAVLVPTDGLTNSLLAGLVVFGSIRDDSQLRSSSGRGAQARPWHRYGGRDGR